MFDSSVNEFSARRFLSRSSASAVFSRAVTHLLNVLIFFIRNTCAESRALSQVLGVIRDLMRGKSVSILVHFLCQLKNSELSILRCTDVRNKNRIDSKAPMLAMLAMLSMDTYGRQQTNKLCVGHQITPPMINITYLAFIASNGSIGCMGCLQSIHFSSLWQWEPNSSSVSFCETQFVSKDFQFWILSELKSKTIKISFGTSSWLTNN